MIEKLNILREKAQSEISVSNDEQSLLKVKSTYLGKDSEISSIMKQLKDLSIEEKKQVGQLSNEIKNEISNLIKEKLSIIEANSSKKISFDHTMPVSDDTGTLHPITIVAEEVVKILKKMGLCVTGSEMESDYYNFEGLNIAENHPARICKIHIG